MVHCTTCCAIIYLGLVTVDHSVDVVKLNLNIKGTIYVNLNDISD